MPLIPQEKAWKARKDQPKQMWMSLKTLKTEGWAVPRHGAEQYAGDVECVFYGYHLDRAILKIADAAYCFMPSLAVPGVGSPPSHKCQHPE